MKSISAIALLLLVTDTQAVNHRRHHHQHSLVQADPVPATIAKPAAAKASAAEPAPAPKAAAKPAENAKAKTPADASKPANASASATAAAGATPAPKIAVKTESSNAVPKGYVSPFAFGNTDLTEPAEGADKASGTPSRRNDNWPKPDYLVDGNGGTHEKQDAFWHIGNQTKNAVDFDHWAWKNPAIHNVNYWDKEPKTHSNGITSLNELNRSDWGTQLNNHPNPWFNNWEDGNGSGNEKMDAFNHIAWASKD